MLTRRLRAAAVTGCTALLCVTAGLTASPAAADDTPPVTPAFTLAPAYGIAGQTVRIDAAGTTTFPTDGTAAVTFTGDPTAVPTQSVSPTTLDVVVPAPATTGPVAVVAGTTTYAGPTFTVQQPTAWTATLTPDVLTYGKQAVVSATLSTTGALPLPVSGASATLQHRTTDTGSWHLAPGTDSKATDDSGHLSWRVQPSGSGEYRVRFGSQVPDYAASVSDTMDISVRPEITVRAHGTVQQGAMSRITGAVHPHFAGKVQLEQRLNGSWSRVASSHLDAGRFSFSVNPTSYALLRYRVVTVADDLHDAATSSVVTIQVVHRQLSYGSTGADVKALQKRLRALHYDVGPASSFYGWDMVHAVTAFQKVQGVYRNGVAGTSVWADLAKPKVPHLLHKNVSGTTVEVNLKQQILMIAKNGVIWRILDTSTAGGYTYTDTAGKQATAITPTGHFTIQYKIDHLVKDKLGTLFRPSYFDYSGDAIHGEGDSNAGGDVPAYPASHGCVRITDLAVDRYYDVFAIGVQVWIYH